MAYKNYFCKDFDGFLLYCEPYIRFMCSSLSHARRCIAKYPDSNLRIIRVQDLWFVVVDVNVVKCAIKLYNSKGD